MTAKVDSLLVKVQTQLLRATFIKNMASLKERMPAIYEYYQNYSAKSVQLTLDDKGNANLVSGGHFVYQEDPKLSSLAQVEEFLKKAPPF